MEEKITLFQKKIYALVSTIPAGHVTTYKYLAEAAGVNCARAVGQALKRNPFAPAVPCHRVIASDLSIGGYAGARSGKLVKQKKSLLEAEGVQFVGKFLKDCRIVCKPGVTLESAADTPASNAYSL
jgi:methylated-DNA-[protein]-cysteine S-methyltransferase